MKVLKHATRDRTADLVSLPQLLTTEQISPNISKTPNGNLVCKNVPIARVGWMHYAQGEVPVDVGDDGIARVYRGPEELFAVETIASFMSVAVTDEHPDNDVTPANWKQLSRGFTTNNVRQGTGEDADLLLADLVITEERLIQSVLDNKREVSCGYDASYEQTGHGKGKQTKIIGNHIALVERGRCGPRCSIGDSDNIQFIKENEMTKRVQLKAAVRRRFADMGAEMESELSKFPDDPTDTNGDDTDMGANGTHIHIHASGAQHTDPKAATQDEPDAEAGDVTEQRIAALEQGLQACTQGIASIQEMLRKQQAPAADEQEVDNDGTNNDVAYKDGGEDVPDEGKAPAGASTKDSAAMQRSYSTLASQAELLVPGIRIPTFDAAVSRAKTVDRMCALRRHVLDTAYSTASGKELIDSVSNNANLHLPALSCAQIAGVFNSAAGAMRLLNNRASVGDAQANQTKQAPGNTLAEINKANAAYWASK